MAQRLFKIITDSSCDMPKAYYESNGVEVLQLGFFLDNVAYGGEDGEYMEESVFYEKLRNGAMPSTYQISSAIAKEHIEKHVKNGDNVFVLTFSSGLSGTSSSFRVAAKEVMEENPGSRVVVVDSLCASMGEGLLLDYLVKKADKGATLEQTEKYIEELKLHICHLFTVDDLNHLKRGGRISATTALVGSMLKIKPVLHVDNEGHLVNISKAMGRKKAIRALVEKMEAEADITEEDPIFISHGDCLNEAEYLASLVKELWPNNNITINCIGAVIGSHSGCGTLALFYKGKNR